MNRVERSGSNIGNVLRAIALVLLVTVCSLAGVIPAEADPANGNATAPEGAAPTPNPKIREIRIEMRDVFDGPKLGPFYRTVNSLKINTKEDVVRRELLFKAGDTYDEFLVQESIRNLRSLSFLREVSVVPIRDGEYVDIVVSVQDTWTVIPQVGFSTGSGKDKTSVGIAETNFLGYGKRAEIFYADDEGRQTTEAVWDDSRLFGTRQRLTLGVFERSDGYRAAGFYGRPFRSLVEPRSWAAVGESFDLVGRLFDDGEERFIFRQRRTAASGGLTLRHGDPEELTRRFTMGYDYIRDQFKQADEEDFEDVDVDPEDVSRDPALLADDREFSGPFIAYQQIEPDFISMNYLDRFERVEDLNLGNEFDVKLGFAGEKLGSKEDTGIFKIADSDGFRFSPTSFMRMEATGETRLDHEGFDNTLAYAGLRYYNVLGAKYLGDTYIGKHTIASSINFDYAEDLDKDLEFLLGASNGLRGYEARTFTGNKRIVWNLEDRFHVAEDVLRLVNIGGAVFTDVGGSTAGQLNDLFEDEIYADVGIGLRLGFPRSSGGGIVRVDLAFPLRDGPDGSNQFEPRLLITTGPLFTSRLRTSSYEPKPPTVETGQDR